MLVSETTDYIIKTMILTALYCKDTEQVCVSWWQPVCVTA